MSGWKVVPPSLDTGASPKLGDNRTNKAGKATQRGRCIVSKVCHVALKLFVSVRPPFFLPAIQMSLCCICCQSTLVPWFTNIYREPAGAQEVFWYQR